MPFRILGLKKEILLKTPDGKIEKVTLKPIKVKDYEKFSSLLNILNLEDFQFHEVLREGNTKDVIGNSIGESDDSIINSIYENIDSFNSIVIKNNISLFGGIILARELDLFVPILEFLKERLVEIFDMCFIEEDVFLKIDSLENFNMCKKAIREHNGISYEPPSPNPEIRRLDNMRRKMEEMQGNTITFESMYTSIMIESGYLPEEINELTLYQFFKAFSRISLIKGYETSTLYATVSEKVNVVPWYTDEIKENKKQRVMTEEELQKAKRRKI